MTLAEIAVDRMNSKVGKFLELPPVGVAEKSQWRRSRLSQMITEIFGYEDATVTFRFMKKSFERRNESERSSVFQYE